jgi:hypothetical protein
VVSGNPATGHGYKGTHNRACVCAGLRVFMKKSVGATQPVGHHPLSAPPQLLLSALRLWNRPQAACNPS